MKNIVLDIVMAFLCIVCACTFIGLMLIPVLLEYWKDMRN